MRTCEHCKHSSNIDDMKLPRVDTWTTLFCNLKSKFIRHNVDRGTAGFYCAEACKQYEEERWNQTSNEP